MESYIKGLKIFKDNTESGSRTLVLSKGLNIITGHSKTGKSAVLDIIDWCLGAKECTIPQGKITEFANLYVILIELNGQSVILAREDEHNGKNYLHISKVASSLTINQISLSDILKENFYKRNKVLDFINEIIDLSFDKEKLQFEVEQKIPKTNIRSSLAYIFQHQDIISSNNRLFYEDPKFTHFPVLAGWYGPEYYILLDLIDKTQKQVKNLGNRKKKAAEENSILERNVKEALYKYYNLVGVEFNISWTIEDCIKRIEKLEDYKKQEYRVNLFNDQERLDKEIERLNVELIRIDRQRQKIKNQMKQGDNYRVFLEKYKDKSELYRFENTYKCPMCLQSNDELIIGATEIIKAQEWLKQELVTLPKHTGKFDKELNNLNLDFTKLDNEVKGLRKIYNTNKQFLDKINKEKNLNEHKQKAKWRVTSELEIYRDRRVKFDDKMFDEAKSKLNRFRERKATYNEKEKYEIEKKIIEEHISRIVEKLDFEHKPPELYFELNPKKDNSFKLYHNSLDNKRIFLRQIGSASNALACHIGLFLSFLNYFSNQKNSKVPSIIFFDQPSQVYFPSGTDNTDIIKVAQIYKTILDELKLIKEETGILPQIIVADHIKDLGKNNVNLYETYFKADWRDGSGLI